MSDFKRVLIKDEHYKWIFSGVGVLGISLVITMFLNWYDYPLGVFGSEKEAHVFAKWRAGGEDLSVPGHIEYSFRLQYEGHIEIRRGLIAPKASGVISGIEILEGEADNSRKPREYTWNLEGRSYVINDYLVIAYNQRNRRFSDAFGVLFTRLEPHGASANGFFLAKRAVDDDRGSEPGIGFGTVRLQKE